LTFGLWVWPIVRFLKQTSYVFFLFILFFLFFLSLYVLIFFKI
jgi:hypothetical protein